MEANHHRKKRRRQAPFLISMKRRYNKTTCTYCRFTKNGVVQCKHCKATDKLLGVRPKYWFHILEHYCPLCGKSKKYRQGMHGVRPKLWAQRHTTHEVYDHCDD